VAQALEDLADEDQQYEVQGRGRPDEPVAPQQADSDGADDNVGRSDVDEVAVRGRESSGRDALRDDALAHQGPDDVR